jgi:hypothetical protein
MNKVILGLWDRNLEIDYHENRDVYRILWRGIELRAVKDRLTAFTLYTQLLREE